MARKNHTLTINFSEPVPDDIYEWAAQHADSSLCHSREWHALIKKSLGYETFGMTARSPDGQPVFFMPYVIKRGLTHRKSVICYPLGHSVGPLSKDRHILQDVLGKAPYKNIRINAQINYENATPVKTGYVTTIDLSGKTIDEVFSSFSKSSIQRKINKATKEGVEVTRAKSEKEYEIFTEMQAETRRRQGSPTFPQNWFPTMYQLLNPSGTVHLFTAYHRGSPAAGIIFLTHKNTAIYGYGASFTDEEAFRAGVNQAAMWEAIKYAHQKNLQYIDLGTTPLSHTSLLEYKLKWGAEKRDAFVTFVNPVSTSLSLSRNSKATHLASSLLKMTPISIFKAVSPLLLKAVL